MPKQRSNYGSMSPAPRNLPQPPPPAAFAALLAPFAALPEEKKDVLRDVLQIYVSKDSGKHTELEKRKRLSALINDYVKGASADEEDEA